MKVKVTFLGNLFRILFEYRTIKWLSCESAWLPPHTTSDLASYIVLLVGVYGRRGDLSTRPFPLAEYPIDASHGWLVISQ